MIIFIFGRGLAGTENTSILLRFTRGAFGLLWKNLKRLVYMERLTNPLACSRPNPRTKQKT
jgi:hypothetical protein